MDLADRNTRAMLGYKLESQTNDEIDLKLLQAYLEATEKYGNTKVNIRYLALKLKYEALTTVPTIIKKTMSPAQLYASGSPLWANNYKGITVERILGKLYEEPKTEEDFNRALASVLGSKKQWSNDVRRIRKHRTNNIGRNRDGPKKRNRNHKNLP